MTISNVDMADYVLNVGQLGMMQHIVMCKGLEGLPVNSVNGVDNGLREGHEHATLHHILSSPCPVVSHPIKPTNHHDGVLLSLHISHFNSQMELM